MECVDCPVRRYTLYSSASDEDLINLNSARLGDLKYGRGRLIMEDQRDAAYVYTLRSGWAYAYSLLSDGRRQILNFFHPGDFLTLPGLFGKGIRASVRSVTEVHLCQFDKAKLQNLLMESKTTVPGLYEYLGFQKRGCDERMIRLGALNAEEAVAALILEFVHEAKKRESADDDVRFPLKLVEVAETVGITEIHAGRVIRELERKGAILRTKPGWLKVKESDLSTILAPVERLLASA